MPKEERWQGFGHGRPMVIPASEIKELLETVINGNKCDRFVVLLMGCLVFIVTFSNPVIGFSNTK